MALIALFGVIVYILYQAWQKDYHSAAALPETTAATAAVSEQSAVVADGGGARITVETDTLRVEIDPRGGDLRRVELLHYPLHKNDVETKLALLDDRDGHWSVLQAGLAGPQRAYDSAETVFGSAQTQYRLADGVDELDVPLTYTDPQGYVLTKVYRFHRGGYSVELEQNLQNTGSEALNASPWLRWVRKPPSKADEPPFVHTFAGFGLYKQEGKGKEYRYKKTSFADLDKNSQNFEQTGGWLAAVQHYFVSAILPEGDEPLQFSIKPSTSIKGAYVGQYVGAAHEVAPGATQTYKTRLYIGPKLQGHLAVIAPGFELTEDYGWMKPIAVPLFWILKHYHGLTGNWGVAIILLTLTVRLAFFKLTEAQYRSMAKTRRFAPRIQEIRERYAEDREKLNKAMMDLYRKEGFNPLAGCWPLLVQFPVFISLYWVLIESVELRQAPFALWINDLTAADHLYVLPVLYGFSMWLQQRLSGQTATMDPMQARIMNIMPIAMTGMFAFFPSGLVLYWFISNSIGISQQWLINRKLSREGHLPH